MYVLRIIDIMVSYSIVDNRIIIIKIIIIILIIIIIFIIIVKILIMIQRKEQYLVNTVGIYLPHIT